MRFEWSETKSVQNLRKHKLSFDLAKTVFDDPFQLNVPDRAEHGEERWTTISMVHGTVLTVVVHTFRDTGEEEVVRIISARKATKEERRRYEQDTVP